MVKTQRPEYTCPECEGSGLIRKEREEGGSYDSWHEECDVCHGIGQLELPELIAWIETAWGRRHAPGEPGPTHVFTCPFCHGTERTSLRRLNEIARHIQGKDEE